MITFAPKTDETGLHAVDCECVRCESGYRPTELERAAARRTLALRNARLAAIARKAGDTEPKPARATLLAPVIPRPMSAEDLAAMADDVLRMKRGSNVNRS